MRIKTLYLHIVTKLRSLSDQNQAEKDKIYHKAGYKSYGLKIPQVKLVIRTFNKSIKNLSLGEKFDLAKNFYKSGYAEEGRIGNAILAFGVNDIKPEHFSYIDKLLDDFNNWDEVDDFSINLSQPLLQKYPREMLNLLRTWNTSANMWKRRASVVAFVRKVGASGRYTNEVFNLCNNLLNDREDLVLKAVGWVLKDNIPGSRNKVIDYIKGLRRDNVSSVITLYAIRSLSNKQKGEILAIKLRRGGEKP